MSIRTRIFGSGADEPLLRAKKPKGAVPDVLNSVAVIRSESRRGNARVRDRHRLNQEQALLRHDGQEHVVELVNLSGGGAMIRCDLGLVLWDQVGLVLGEGGQLDCAVRWIRDDCAGLEFAHETRIDCGQQERDALLRDVVRRSFPEAQIDSLDPTIADEDDGQPADCRQAERHPLIWSGVVYHDFEEIEPVRLRNISATGALVQSGHELETGSTVYLEIGGLDRLQATVRWTRGGQSGLEFHEPFNMPSLAEAAPEIAPSGGKYSSEFGTQEPWAPGWRRSTIGELARNLGG